MTATRLHRHDSQILRQGTAMPVTERAATHQLTWIDYRASTARADRRCDPPVCPCCGCETDLHPIPHSPRCPETP